MARGKNAQSAGAWAASQANPTLKPLHLSGSAQSGVSSSIGIVGATIGSTLSISAGTLPTGLTLNSAARTITGTPTGATATVTITETLASAVGSPKTNSVSVVVAAAPNVDTAVAYTFIRTDENRVVPRSNASAQTVTVPPNSEVAFPVGTVLTVEQTGAGALTIVAGAGVTLNKLASQTLVVAGQNGLVQLRKTATDTWTVFGALTAA